VAWKRNPSGTFEAQETHRMHAANTHLRYDLIEAANRWKNHHPEDRSYYLKKYQEVRQHQLARALALTARKWVR
jgi:hypothetical protein